MTALPATPTARYRTDLVTSLLSVWFMVGLMLDAWAHNNLPGLESFFTPWHAVFYTGFVAVGLWIAWTARAGIRDGKWVPTVMPRGYPAATLALVGFAISGFGDFIWHKVFGIEQSIDILFSPTHLGLAATMMIIITTPLRSFWSDPSLPPAPGLGRAFPAVLSVGLAAALVQLFLQYSNALTFDADNVVLSLSGGRTDRTAAFVGALAVTNLILIVPLLLLARRCRLPVGAATVGYAVVAGLAAAITSFEFVGLTVTLVLAGVLVDVVSLALRPGPENIARYRIFALLAPLLTWAIYLSAANALSGAVIVGNDQRPESGVELWTGAPVVQALLGLLVATLLIPTAPDRVPSQRSSANDATSDQVPAG